MRLAIGTLIYGQRKPRLTCDGMHLKARVGRQQTVAYGRILPDIEVCGSHNAHNGATTQILLDSEFVALLLELGIIVIGIEDANQYASSGMCRWCPIIRGQHCEFIAISTLSVQSSSQINPARVGEDAKVLGQVRIVSINTD